MMKLEKDIEDLNLDFSDRCIDKPKAFKNLVYEFHLHGDSSGTSSLESLDFGYDDGYIFDHQLEFPAIHIEKEEQEVSTIKEEDETLTTKSTVETEANNEVAEASTVNTESADNVS